MYGFPLTLKLTLKLIFYARKRKPVRCTGLPQPQDPLTACRNTRGKSRKGRQKVRRDQNCAGGRRLEPLARAEPLRAGLSRGEEPWSLPRPGPGSMDGWLDAPCPSHQCPLFHVPCPGSISAAPCPFRLPGLLPQAAPRCGLLYLTYKLAVLGTQPRRSDCWAHQREARYTLPHLDHAEHAPLQSTAPDRGGCSASSAVPVARGRYLHWLSYTVPLSSYPHPLRCSRSSAVLGKQDGGPKPTGAVLSCAERRCARAPRERPGQLKLPPGQPSLSSCILLLPLIPPLFLFPLPLPPLSLSLPSTHSLIHSTASSADP